MEKSKFELSVDLVKALAWPAVVGLLLLSFWNPLQKTANLLPSIIDRSDVITISGLSLKVSREMGSEAPAEVRAVLKRLSPQGVMLLLEFTELHSTSLFSQEEMIDREWGELVRNGIVVKSLVVNAPGPLALPWRVQLTPLGVAAKSYLTSLLTEIIRQVEPTTSRFTSERG